MLILYGLVNEAICISKDLRHNWLGHEVLPFDAEFISRIYLGDSPSRDRFDERIRPGGTFERYLKQASALSAIIIDGFSPAQLVNDGPLGALSEEARRLIRDVLHDAYVKQTGIRQLSQAIQVAVSDLLDQYQQFVEDWYREPLVGQARIKANFEEVQRRARVLYELLDKLPRGVVLP